MLLLLSKSCRRNVPPPERNVIIQMPGISVDVNTTIENKNTIALPQSVPTTTLQEDPSAIQAVEDYRPAAAAGKTLGEASSSLPTSRNRLLVTIFNDEYADKDGGEVEKLAAIKDNAKMIQELLKSKFGYETPSEDPTIFEPGKLKNQANLVKTFEVFLKKWKKAQPAGRTIDRFFLYYHGHGVQVRV